MFYIEPNTRIELMQDIPVDPQYENTLYFNNVAEQNTYFNNKTVMAINKASYQREERGWLKISFQSYENDIPLISRIYNVNYMRFRNNLFEDKWFYAFVDQVEYVNNNTVRLRYHIDVIQTWLFQIEFSDCLIDREHTEHDYIFMNTLDEGLETGEYENSIINHYEYTNVVLLVTAGDSVGQYTPGSNIEGMGAFGVNPTGDMFSGLTMRKFFLRDTQDLQTLNDELEAYYTDRTKLNDVVAIVNVPSMFANDQSQPEDVQITFPSTIGSYVPLNKKLFCYPYSFLYISNMQGDANVIRYEMFGNNPGLQVWGNFSVNPGLLCAPKNYKGQSINYDEMLTITGFPMSAWCNDAYKAWVAQNAGTISAGITAAEGAIMSGLSATPYYDKASPTWNDPGNLPKLPTRGSRGSPDVSFDPSGYLLSYDASKGYTGIMAALGIMGQILDHRIKPPTAHGNGNGNLLYQAGLMTFCWWQKHIRPEYAKKIDDFFNMYGYKVNRIGKPVIMNRPCYKYTKTIGCSIHGDIPSDDVRTLESIFDSGVRFWRSTAVFGDYNYLVNDNRPNDQ